MVAQTHIPFPIKYNALKHHRNSILQLLENATHERIIELMDPLCHNHIDIYAGTMTPSAIGSAIITALKSKGVFFEAHFKSWIAEEKGYVTVPIEDGSEWVLLANQDTDRYIHIHPARTGLFSFRFKGTTLKTAFLLRKNFGNDINALSLENVNQVRRQIHLSPIKKLTHDKGILRCYKKFFDTKQQLCCLI
jgi:hypothetical protein